LIAIYKRERGSVGSGLWG